MKRYSIAILLSILSLFIFIIVSASMRCIAFAGSNEIPLNVDENINDMIQWILPRRQMRLKREMAEEGYMLKCATPVVKYAIRHRELLLPESRFILYRPTDEWDDDYYGNVKVLTYKSQGGLFLIHYTEDNTYGDAVYGFDGNQATIPPYIHYLARYFDEIWEKETGISEMHYITPRLDGSFGGDYNTFDIYVLNLSTYGYTAIDTHGFLYICMHKNFWKSSPGGIFDPNSTQAGLMKVTAAHEFFHSIQYEYEKWYDADPAQYLSNIWWEESTAVWMEDELYDEVNDYLRYLPERFRQFSLSLDYNKANPGYYEYGGVIFSKFLSEMYGRDSIRESFERCKQSKPPLAKTAIGATLQVYGAAWDTAMKEFFFKNLIRDYEEGLSYPLLNFYDVIASYEMEPGYSRDSSVEHLACHYLKLESDPYSDANREVYITFRSNGIIAPVVLLAGNTNAGTPTRDSTSLIQPISGMNYYMANFGHSGNYSQAFLMIINESPTSTISYSLKVTYDAPPGFGYYYSDLDGDNYGDPNSLLISFTHPEGYVLDDSDCIDDDPSVHPGVKEIHDEKDNDCNGIIDDIPAFICTITSQSQLVQGIAIINGLPIENGDWIGVFADGVEVNRGCIGFVKIEDHGGYVITVYGDNPETPEKDGAQIGDRLIFSAWDESEKCITPLHPHGPDETIWTGQPETKEINLSSDFEQIIPLTKGWNLISFQVRKCFYDRMLPSISLIDSNTLHFESKEDIKTWLLDDQNSPLRDANNPYKAGDWQRITSFDGTGAHILDVNLPSFINTLHYLSFGYGYWIKMNEPGLLILQGESGTTALFLNLKKGWNLMGFIPPDVCFGKSPKTKEEICPYYREAYTPDEGIGYCPIDVFMDTVLWRITGQYRRITAFDHCNGAMIYDTELPDFINTLHYCGPKYGYWIKMLEDGMLYFPEGCGE